MKELSNKLPRWLVEEVGEEAVEKELLHEQEMISSGSVRYNRLTAATESRGLASKTTWGHTLLAQVIAPTAEAIRVFISKGSRTGRKNTAQPYLLELTPEVMAFITAQAAIDGTMKTQSLQHVALQVGARVRDEVRMRDLENNEESASLFRTIKNDKTAAGNANTPNKRRQALWRAAKKFQVTVADWPVTDRLHVGMALLGCLVDSTKLFEYGKSSINRNRAGGLSVLHPTDKLIEFVEAHKDRMELLCPDTRPMRTRPLPWISMTSGGYYHPGLKRRLVRTSNRSYIKEMSARSGEMKDVYRAVNALQDTPWKINSAVLDVVEEVFQAGHRIKGMPLRFDIQCVPPLPKDHPQWLKNRIHNTRAFHTNEKNKSRRMQVARVMHVAKSLRDDPCFYYPWYLDFRGRAYPIVSGLQPQGSDLARGLLLFAGGEPLGERGAWWLAFQLANVFGKDKLPLEERVAWTRENSDRICAVAANPREELWWTEADKPCQFLAACIEWAGYIREGESYVCSLPIGVDGTCSGIQHYAAMSRDAVAGKCVNLLPSEKPNDIYADVARQVVALMKADLTSTATQEHNRGKETFNIPLAEMAAAWLKYDLKRDCTKRQTMVLPYGGTMTSCREYTEAWVKEQLDENLISIDDLGGPSHRAYVHYLAVTINAAIRDVVIGPVEVMAWVRKCAHRAAKSGLPLIFQVPSGFIVHQAYFNLEHRRIKTKLGERLVFLTLQEENDVIDPRRHATTTPPNFVHAHDAAALMLTFSKCIDRGIRYLSATHDDYKTLPSRMDTMNLTLREEFVRMYTEHDVLQEIYEVFKRLAPIDEEIELPPAKGTLDINQVIPSKFFFA